MVLEINEEQIAYIKGLTSKKKQRKFLLNCMIEQIEKIEMVKVSESPRTVYSEVPPFYLDEAIEFSQSAKPNISLEEKCDVCKTYPKIENSNKCESCHSCIKHIVETSPEFAKYRAKPNYSPEEIEIVKSDMKERQKEAIEFMKPCGNPFIDSVNSRYGAELLKLDQIDIEINEFTKNLEVNEPEVLTTEKPRN